MEKHVSWFYTWKGNGEISTLSPIIKSKFFTSFRLLNFTDTSQSSMQQLYGLFICSMTLMHFFLIRLLDQWNLCLLINEINCTYQLSLWNSLNITDILWQPCGQKKRTGQEYLWNWYNLSLMSPFYTSTPQEQAFYSGKH